MNFFTSNIIPKTETTLRVCKTQSVFLLADNMTRSLGQKIPDNI